MFGRKGQGALEYLLILAAVLAIAVVVILVAHQVATPAQQSALVNEDKYSCAQAGIELVNYNRLPDRSKLATTTSSGQSVLVKYNGKTYNCVLNTQQRQYGIAESGKILASCKIHFSDGSEAPLTILHSDYVFCSQVSYCPQSESSRNRLNRGGGYQLPATGERCADFGEMCVIGEIFKGTCSGK